MRTLVTRLASAIVVCFLLAPCLPVHATPPWVEPRALNVVDLATQVPDDALRGHTVAYGNPGGLVTYDTSSWDGPKLRVRVSIYPRFRNDASFGWVSDVSTLAHKPVFDRMSSSMPASHVRLYDGSRDVTGDVLYTGIMEPALARPQTGSGDPRYANAWTYAGIQKPLPADGVPLPANWAGSLTVRNTYHSLSAVFTVQPAARPTVQYLGQQSFEYPSYIGPGWVGWFSKLMSQMRSRYADRHPRLSLSVPPGANYVLFAYDPLPYDIEAGFGSNDRVLYDRNRSQPTGGTVRMAPDPSMLSQDITHAGPVPLRVWWQDADQSEGPYLSVFTTPIVSITPPEFVLLPGTAYNPCFVDGGCSSSVLEDVYNRRTTIRVIYLRVTPPATGVIALPLRMADTDWSPSMALASSPALKGLDALPHRAFVPFVAKPPAPIPLPAERPVGFFEPSSGRMVGYLAD